MRRRVAGSEDQPRDSQLLNVNLELIPRIGILDRTTQLEGARLAEHIRTGSVESMTFNPRV